MSKYCFTVSSAINTRVKAAEQKYHTELDLYDPKVRFDQLIETLKCLKLKVECDIIVVESSSEPISDYYKSEIEKYAEIYMFSNDISKRLYDKVSITWKLQNSMETLANYNFLKEYRERLIAYERIFKISGRYLLTNNFDISKHTCKYVKDKFLFLTENRDGLSTRLYSYDSSLVDYHIKISYKILEYMQEVGHGTDNYTSLEAGYRKFIEPQYLITTKVIGVCGYNANMGGWCDE